VWRRAWRGREVPVLTELAISNFAIIKELKVDFSAGLNVLTGETGAGKSIIVGAISLLLGDRASADMIRTGEETATVTAVFDTGGNEEVRRLLASWGWEDEGEVVVTRTITRAGKNRIYINGNRATLQMLCALSENLVTICGQHEHQVLLREENHLDILDEYGGLNALRDEYVRSYEEVRDLEARLADLEERRTRRSAERDLLAHQIAEIDAVAPLAGEDRTLGEERAVLVNVRTLADLARRAYDVLYGSEGAVLERLKTVSDAVREIRRLDPRLGVTEGELDSIYYQLEETAFALRDYGGGLVFDPGRLEVIDDRLERLSRLKRKYGPDLEAVLARRREMERDLAALGALDEDLAAVRDRLAGARRVLEERGEALSRERRRVARDLEGAVEGEIAALRMAGARFAVVFREREGQEPPFGPRGMDRVAFWLSTNPGEEPRPLSRVASGGELSRVTLALRNVLAGTGSAGTIILDEVDSGIGGGTAEAVGEKVRQVARRYQVLCITHLPQIACFGERHYRVSKAAEGDRTTTRVEILTEEERVEEIARMLAGPGTTGTARRHAREMLSGAAKKGGVC